VVSGLRKQREEERKRRTRKQLLDAAARVFIRKGYHNPNISDIVAEAGVGQGTFYRNFRDKRDIFETLLEGFISGLLGEFSEMSAHPPTHVREYRDASIQALRRMVRIVERNRKLVLLFIREAPAVDEHVAQVMGGMYDRFGELAKYYLDHAIKSGFVRPCRSEVIAQSIVGMGLRMAERWLDGRYSEIPVDDLIAELVEFAFKGLEPRTREGGSRMEEHL
jgi:AcrR family transcriptional regulator